MLLNAPLPYSSLQMKNSLGSNNCHPTSFDLRRFSNQRSLVSGTNSLQLSQSFKFALSKGASHRKDECQARVVVAAFFIKS